MFFQRQGVLPAHTAARSKQTCDGPGGGAAGPLGRSVRVTLGDGPPTLPSPVLINKAHNRKSRQNHIAPLHKVLAPKITPSRPAHRRGGEPLTGGRLWWGSPRAPQRAGHSRGGCRRSSAARSRCRRVRSKQAHRHRHRAGRPVALPPPLHHSNSSTVASAASRCRHWLPAVAHPAAGTSNLNW